MAAKVLTAIISTLALLTANTSGVSAQDPKLDVPPERAADAEKIWAQELRIYEMRRGGDMGYYLSLANPGYMAWPAPADVPLSYEQLSARIGDGQLMEAGERITVTKKGLSFDGDTALAFFETHRTQRAGGQAVDERFENIHVWVKRDEDWRLIANMSLAGDENRQSLGKSVMYNPLTLPTNRRV